MFELLTDVREQQPLVLNLANTVTQQHVADAINAIGGSPLMSAEPQEVAELVSIASAVVLNIGTLSERDYPFFVALGRAANDQGKPVVLDPVAVMMPYRGDFVKRLLTEIKVNIIRGNAAEIGWFAQTSVAGKGIDALDEQVVTAIPVAASKATGAIIVQTGKTDIVTDGQETALVQHDSKLLAVNVGAGDMLSGLVGTLAAVTNDYRTAALVATILMGVAGERATDAVDGLPGHFMGALFNELYRLTASQLAEQARYTTEETV